MTEEAPKEPSIEDLDLQIVKLLDSIATLDKEIGDLYQRRKETLDTIVSLATLDKEIGDLYQRRKETLDTIVSLRQGQDVLRSKKK